MATEDVLKLFHEARRYAQIRAKLDAKSREYAEYLKAIADVMKAHALWKVGTVLRKGDGLYSVTSIEFVTPQKFDLKPIFEYCICSIVATDWEGNIVLERGNEYIRPENQKYYVAISGEALRQEIGRASCRERV